jgi:hypothetical protein
MFYASKPADIAAATGLPLDVSTRIIDRFTAYRRDAESLSPGAAREAERMDLERLVNLLRAQNDEFERLSAAWSNDVAAKRSRLRSERADTLLKIDVTLARLGDVDLVLALAKMPFAAKIRELLRYLNEAKERAEPT